MPTPIPPTALSFKCSNASRRYLCNRLGVPESQVAKVESLAKLQPPLDSEPYQFVAVDSDLLAEPDEETLANLRKLSSSSAMLIIVGKELTKEVVKTDLDVPTPIVPMRPASDVVPLIEHESCNVLQRINLLIELIKAETKGNEKVSRNIARICAENKILRKHIGTIRQICEPIDLDPELFCVRELINASWRELSDEKPPGIRPKFNLTCDQKFALDADKFKTAIGSIFNYLFSIIDEDSAIELTDFPRTIIGRSFLQVDIVGVSTTEKRTKPRVELALSQKIIESHGGLLEFEISNPSKTVCTLYLPEPNRSYGRSA